jgi:hypothetical protein
MTPMKYMDCYMSMTVILDNYEPVQVKNDRYRNNGIASTREADADTVKDLINGAVGGENKSRVIDGYFIDKLKVYDVFTGKASPDQTRDVIWLAHRYGLIKNVKRPRAVGGYKPVPWAQDFCDKYTGLDCNGFTANYYGLPRGDHTVASFGPRELRLQDPEDVDARCSLVFFSGNDGKHIGVLEEAKVVGETLKLKLVQSSGLKYGLNVKDLDVAIPADLKKAPAKAWVLSADRHGDIYFLDGYGRHAYPCLPLTDDEPNS